jgi:hypothetical protein
VRGETSSDCKGRALTGSPDRPDLHAAFVVVQLAAGELKRERVDAARKLLAAALAMLDEGPDQ